MPKTSFDQILEMIDNLSLDEQEDLINIAQNRQADKRREEIASNITNSRLEYQKDEVFRGTVDDIISELNE
ncbi:MAG: hypothetical protein ACRC1Z_07560 [Waterburya sp.]|jgi:hypothetical protein